MEVQGPCSGDFFCMHRMTALLDQGRSILKKKRREHKLNSCKAKEGTYYSSMALRYWQPQIYCKVFTFSLIVFVGREVPLTKHSL